MFAGFEFQSGTDLVLGYAHCSGFLLVKVLVKTHVRPRDFMMSSDAKPADLAVRLRVATLGVLFHRH